MTAYNPSSEILCFYTNCSAQFQLIRISNISHWFFERTVLPKGSILFMAFVHAQLEVHTSEAIGAILSDVIPCSQLVPAKRYSA